MERILTAEERIRKAEEIYQRRKASRDIKVPSSHVNANKQTKEYSLYKKLVLQIIICLLIYFIVFLVRNSNYIFSENFINKTKQILSYDINFQKVYANAQEYYNKNVKSLLFKENNNEQENSINVEEQENKEASIVNENKEEKIGIGGGEEGAELINNEVTEIFNSDVKETSADETTEKKEEKNLSQMEIDANDIKSKYSLIIPLKGTVTSRFGTRTPTDIVSANHAGIDIGVNAGTVFVSAMDGRVKEVSSEGSYGKHVYIEKDDVITLYAHCQKIYVNNGENIKQGQKIGEVGSTGKATGPHLHFEIRKSNRVVNPEYILTF